MSETPAPPTARRRAAQAARPRARLRASFPPLDSLLLFAALLLVVLLLCSATWRAEARLVRVPGFPLDDSWIHCVIARNVVQGHGWSYNPGVPVQNSSGPLWTVLVALGFALVGTTVWVPRIMGALCFAGIVLWMPRLARTLGAGTTASRTSALLAATCAPFAWHALSGMETGLAILFLIATLDAFYTWREARRRWLWIPIACLGGATRPELLLLVPILLVERALRGASTVDRIAARVRARDAILAAVLSVLLLVPYFAFNHAQSGSILPTTFAAKSGGVGLLHALRHADLRELAVASTLYPYVWSVGAVTVFGRMNLALLCLVPIGAWMLACGARRALAPALLLLLFPAVRGAAAPYQTPGIQYGRYIAPLVPLFLLCGSMALAAILRRPDELHAALRARRGRIVACAALGLAMFALVRLELRVPHVSPGLLGILPALVGRAPTTGLEPLLRAERLGLVLALFPAGTWLVLGLVRPRFVRVAGWILAAAVLLLQIGHSWRLPSLYARNARNIEDMDADLGRWVRRETPPGTRVAVNDIGAIAWFGERPIVDLLGLATPEIAASLTPQRLRMLVPLSRLRPPVCIVFPSWFESWTSRPSLLQPIARHRVTDNTILGASVAGMYRMTWDRFERYYDAALIDKLDPGAPAATLRDQWKRGLQHLGLETRSELYVLAGDELRDRGDLPRARAHHERAIRLDTADSRAHEELVRVLEALGDRAAHAAALQDWVASVPTSAAAFEALGDYQHARGDSDAMLRAYATALALHPDRVPLLAKLEAWWTAAGDSVRAERYRSRRTELGPAPAE